MDRPLIITPEAEEDLADGKKWYEGQRRGLGKISFYAWRKRWNASAVFQRARVKFIPE